MATTAAADALVTLPGSKRIPWPGAQKAGAPRMDEVVDLTVWLRPRHGGELDAARAHTLSTLAPHERTYLSRKELHAATAADRADVDRLSAHLAHHKIHVVEVDWRSVLVRGTLSALASAFGATLELYVDPEGRQFRQRSGTMSLPRDVAEVVHGVFGFNEWPRAHSMRPNASAVENPTPHPPLLANAVARDYAFPPNADGSGQTIAILQFGGTFNRADYEACMKLNGVKAGEVLTKRVDGADDIRRGETEFDTELALDTQIAGGLAPGARLVLYTAPHSERGFLDVIRTVLFDDELQPSILSISYGWPEGFWTNAALEIFDDLFAAAALLGVSVFASSGDSGADDFDGKPHVRSPASSRFAHACGGTHAEMVDGAIVSENAWNRTGGGFSTREAPPWQTDIHEQADPSSGKGGRGVPDIAAQVIPGYRIVRDGVPTAAGGTSTVAPLWAALTARLNQALGVPLGFYAPLLYERAAKGTLFRKIERGSNGVYHVRKGWNPCTGLGSPVGTAILEALGGRGPGS
jgi:kumamolisin